MIAWPVEIMRIFLLLTTQFLVDVVYCSEPEVVPTSHQPPSSLKYAQTTFGNQRWNGQEGDHLRFSIPVVMNVVVTGQDAFGQQETVLFEDLFMDSNFTSINCSFVDFNFSYINCSENDSSPMSHLAAPTLEESALIRAIVLLLIAVFSLIGNTATLTSILRTGRQGTSTVYMLLVQLAIADLLVSIFCILADALWTLSVQWYGGNFLCKAVKFMQLFALYLSTFLLVLIGFDRLCAVRFPMRRARAKHHVRVGIVCVWSTSAVFSLPQVFIFSVMRGPFVEDFYQCVTYAFYTAQWQEQLYTTLSLVLMFLLPLLVLVSTYIATFLTIVNSGQENMFSERVSRSAIDSARQKILRKAKVKSLMITVVIVFTFLVCWTPYYVTMIIFMFLDPSEQLSQDLQRAIFFFGSSTAAINPLIYGAFHLRPRRRSRSKSTTSLAINSSSSRLTSRILSRKSREESIALQINGEYLTRTASLYKPRYSCIANIEQTTRIFHQNSIPY